MNKNTFWQHGSATAVIVTVVVIILIGAGAAYFFTGPEASPQATTGGEPSVRPEVSSSPRSGVPTPKPTAGNGTVTYSGAVLAGSSSPLLDFNQADFDAALRSNKLVVLYFYANWCPICREEFPKMQGAFNELTGDNVVGFRVNFNDNETDDDEVALARKHGIAYQHTKVILKNGQQVLKSPETWEQSRYLTEIANAAK